MIGLGGTMVSIDRFSDEADMFDNVDKSGYEEWFVEVKWLTNVHIVDTLGSGACYGPPYFYTQLVCSMKKKQDTITSLEMAFNLNFSMLFVSCCRRIIN